MLKNAVQYSFDNFQECGSGNIVQAGGAVGFFWLCTQQKTHNVLRVVENSIVQCCAAHVVHICQQYCSALLYLIVYNYEQCGQQNIEQCCFNSPQQVVHFYVCI